MEQVSTVQEQEPAANTRPSPAIGDGHWPPTYSLFFTGDKAHQRRWRAITAFLLLVVLGGVMWGVEKGSRLTLDGSGAERAYIAFVGAVLVLVPLGYWWVTSMAFDEWIFTAQLSERRERFERQRFKTNSEYAFKFWAGLLALFATYVVAK